MPTIESGELHTLVREILEAAGADRRNADRVAEALVSSNLRGVDSHGVYHVAGYVERIQAGHITPTTWPEILSETPTTALITGNWTFGHVAAKYGIEVAIEKARAQGVSVVGLVQLAHIGRLGEYSEIAASHDMIGMVFASGFGVTMPQSVPYGGRDKLMSTNPIAMGFPAGEETPVVFDFATTVVAGAKVMRARNRGEQVPLGWLVDAGGRPTTDPSGYPHEGGLLPFGGHKGYALMLADELLGRVLVGSDAHIDPDRGAGNRHQGVTMIVLRADLFQPLAGFKRTADQLTRQIASVPPAPGFDEVLTPGMQEERALERRTREGIPIPDDVWKSLSDVAASLNVPMPRPSDT